jgi:hypothetical protein
VVGDQTHNPSKIPSGLRLQTKREERSFNRWSQELNFGGTQELPFIAECLDKATHDKNVEAIYQALPQILKELKKRSNKCHVRNVVCALVGQFGWKYLRKEYDPALKLADQKKLVKLGATALKDSTLVEILI